MPSSSRQRIKQTLISLGVYKPARRIYERFIAPTHTAQRRECMEVFSRFVNRGDLCFDVGANVGHKTAALLELGARVIAIEPQPECQRELRALFGGHPAFQLVPRAVGREPGTAKMHVSADSVVSSLRADWFHRWDAEIEVEVTTLDAVIATHGVPRFCKIDIEGFELEALHGLTRALDVVSLEYNVRYIDQMLACVAYLGRFGGQTINMTLRENIGLQWDEWCPGPEFPDRFRAELERHPESYWGDLFIRSDQAGS